MKKINLLSNVSRTFNKVGFEIKKYSPTILVGAGIVGVVASTVMACKATTKAEAILAETKEHVKHIHECENNEELKKTEQYTEKDAKKDLAIVYSQSAIKLAKIYGPSILLGTASIVSILASHRILTKRNAAISAAYAVVDKGFKDYRSRVKERFGERVDFELKNNIKAEKIESIAKDENGKETTEKKKVEISELDQYSDYARFFDELNPNWNKDAEYNLMFLKLQENNANKRLQDKGYLFLNEVYRMIGIPETKAGQVVGWVYNPEDNNVDSFVDFGIYDTNKRRAQEFVNGYEKAILLDFNVDGNIWSLMK